MPVFRAFKLYVNGLQQARVQGGRAGVGGAWDPLKGLDHSARVHPPLVATCTLLAYTQETQQHQQHPDNCC